MNFWQAFFRRQEVEFVERRIDLGPAFSHFYFPQHDEYGVVGESENPYWIFVGKPAGEKLTLLVVSVTDDDFDTEYGGWVSLGEADRLYGVIDQHALGEIELVGEVPDFDFEQAVN